MDKEGCSAVPWWLLTTVPPSVPRQSRSQTGFGPAEKEDAMGKKNVYYRYSIYIIFFQNPNDDKWAELYLAVMKSNTRHDNSEQIPIQSSH